MKLIRAAQSQNLAIGAASVVSTALSPGRYLVTTSTDCFIRQGTGGGLVVAPTDANAAYLNKGERIILDVDATGDGDRIAVIQSSAGGRLCITWMEGNRE